MLTHLVVRLNLTNQDGEILDSQSGVIVDFLVSPLNSGFRVSEEGKASQSDNAALSPTYSPKHSTAVQLQKIQLHRQTTLDSH